ncbi:hypothetical protein HJG60_010675 [Phyllostomus discolor]|uniref:Uncharacterized protein n=1 Tax=Phyllostomus discolor TaxID=89673 RepID=A0A834EFB1_9CHIR|nr:hypothetical protein HJG60_010675 [Phyllostomus discolor]
MEGENQEGDSEDAIREFDFLGSGEDREGSPDPQVLGDALEKGLTMSWKAGSCGGISQQGILADLRDVDVLIPKVTVTPLGTFQPLPHKGSFGFSSYVFIMDTIGGRVVSLEDLTDLTITHDNDLSCDLSDSKDAFRKMWNPKFIFYSC